MGPLGVPEMAIIAILALVLFGPKKLPELARNFGKAMAEFRRASNELKSTFDHQMRELERETESVKETTNQYTREINNSINGYDYNYDHSYYDSGAYGSEPHDSTAHQTSSPVSAAAPQAADQPKDAVAHATTEPAAPIAGGHPVARENVTPVPEPRA